MTVVCYVSGAKALAALGAARREHFLSILGRHARAEAVTALADQFARLIGAFHNQSP